MWTAQIGVYLDDMILINVFIKRGEAGCTAMEWKPKHRSYCFQWNWLQMMVLANIHWSLQWSLLWAVTWDSQLHIVGAVIIPFYRWKREGIKKISIFSGSYSWQSVQATWFWGSLLPCFQEVMCSERQTSSFMLSQGWWPDPRKSDWRKPT